MNEEGTYMTAKKKKSAEKPTPPCSRCNGTGKDPELSDCTCDCCGGTGVEYTTEEDKR